jgi:hypothetical protein
MDSAAPHKDLVADNGDCFHHAASHGQPSGFSRKRKLPPNPDSLNARAIFSRKRSATACRLCRTRKTKCNNGRPVCSKCNELNARCFYEEDETSYASCVIRRTILLTSFTDWRQSCSNKSDPRSSRVLDQPSRVGILPQQRWGLGKCQQQYSDRFDFRHNRV